MMGAVRRNNKHRPRRASILGTGIGTHNRFRAYKDYFIVAATYQYCLMLMKSGLPQSEYLGRVFPREPKKNFFGWVRLIIAVICVATMVHLLSQGSLSLVFLKSHLWTLIAAALLRPCFTLLMSARARCLSAWVLNDLRTSTLVRATYVGQMANLILPGGAGGDVVRGTILWRKTALPWPRIVTLLVVDRLIGTLSLMLCVAFLGLPLICSILPYKWLGVGVLFMLVITGIVWIWRGPLWRLLQGFTIWSDSINAMRQVPQSAWYRALLLAVIGHAMLILSYSLVFSAVGIRMNLLDQAAVITLSLFLSSLPLTLGGHGIREGSLVVILAAPAAWTTWIPFTTTDQALSLAATNWVIHVVTNFTGGLVALSWDEGKAAHPVDL